MMRVADWIIDRLSLEGLHHIFLLPGGGAMHLNDALALHNKITPIVCQHEQACGISAEAYGRVGKSPGFGVALVTSGPGATNILTPVTGAWIDSLPLMVISGQAKSTDLLSDKPLRQSGVQEVDVKSMIRGITKYVTNIRSASDVVSEFEKALFFMRDGRPGPVWVEVPLDIQGSSISEDIPRSIPFQSTNISPSFSEDHQKFFELLSASERPLVIAGHGVRIADAVEEFNLFIHRFKLPTVCTWNALDLVPHSDDLYVGSPGVVALRAPNFAIQSCDLLISIGCRLDNIITAYNPSDFARNAKKISIDIDINELNKDGVSLDLSFCQSAKSFLLDILESDFSGPKTYDWVDHCLSLKNKYSLTSEHRLTVDSPISHYSLVSTLSSFLPEDCLVVTGSSGLAVEAFYSTFETKSGQRIFLTSGLGSMGYAVPAGIGACLANDNKTTFVIESDGSLMLNIQELATIVHYDLDIKIILMDNGGYSSIRNTQRNYFQSRFIGTDGNSGLGIPNLFNVCQTFGLNSFEVHNLSELETTLAHFQDCSGPSICIVHLDPLEVLLPKVSAIPRNDGSIVSMPLEDMSPLLPLYQLEIDLGYKASFASYAARDLL